MSVYTISYTQTAYWTIEVSASSEEKALEKAERFYKEDTDKMTWGGITDSFYQVEDEA